MCVNTGQTRQDVSAVVISEQAVAGGDGGSRAAGSR
jgi:hypothetical protein